jgi:hypothetical protein
MHPALEDLGQLALHVATGELTLAEQAESRLERVDIVAVSRVFDGGRE